MPRGTFQDCCRQFPHPCGEPLPTHASIGDAQTLAGSFGSVFCGVSAPFLRVLVCTRFCLCPAILESFSPVLWKSYNQVLLAFKVRFSGDSQLPCQISQAGKTDMGFRTFTTWENLFGIIFLQFVGHPSGQYGIWFCRDCTSPTISLQLLLCPLVWGIWFYWVPAFC